MTDGFENSLHILLIKKLLSGISVLDNADDDANFNDQPISSKHENIKLKLINENIISSTNSVSNFSNLLDNNWRRYFSQESVYNDNYNGCYQMENEWDNFSDEKKESQLKMMLMKNKSFMKNKISENEIKATNHSTASLSKNASFVTRCIKQRPMPCYNYTCKTRNSSFKLIELLTPVKEKKWFEDYKMELQFLQQNFSEVLPEILYDVVRKRVTDPVHYIVHYLIKYKVYKLRDVKMYNYLF